MNLNIKNIGVWVINLPTNADRYQRMSDQLERIGLPWKRFDAINGKEKYDELIAGADPDAYAKNMGSPIIPGKLGVYASHKAVWQDFLDSSYDYALIFEDDVIFHEDFLDALNVAYKESEFWDVVRFNCVRAKIPVSQRKIGKWSFNAYVGPFTGNAAYLITKNTAAKLLVSVGPQTRALDHELNRFFHHDFRLIGLEPWASHTDDGNYSTITGVGFSAVKKFKWHRRLPYYRLKFLNYFRRFYWLAKRGMIFRRK